MHQKSSFWSCCGLYLNSAVFDAPTWCFTSNAATGIERLREVVFSAPDQGRKEKRFAQITWPRAGQKGTWSSGFRNSRNTRFWSTMSRNLPEADSSNPQ
jgi:hypothetical protein